MTPFDIIKSAILGNPTDLNKKPSNIGVVQAFAQMQKQLEASQSGSIVKSTLSALELVSEAKPDLMAWVTNDDSNSNNGIYGNIGSLNAPVWERVTDIPQFVISGIQTSESSGDEIEITTDLPVPEVDGRCLIMFEVGETNTVSPTLKINDQDAIPVKSITGGDISAGSFILNMVVLGYIANGEFRLISDFVSAAIVSAAEAARDEAIATNAEVTKSRPSYSETLFLADGQADANSDAPPTDGQSGDQVAIWRSVLSEIPQYHPQVKALVYAGDLTDRGHPSLAEIATNTNDWYGFKELTDDLNLYLPFSEIDALSGNHDRNYLEFAERDTLEPFDIYKQWFSKQFYFKVKGNTVTIFMGDMGRDTKGFITDYVFEWWLEVCNRFRGKNIIVVTHQMLSNTFNGTDTDNDRLIASSQRFIDAMTIYPIEKRITNIAAWINGHSNTQTATDLTHQKVQAHGTTFFNVGLHIPSYAEGDVSDLTYVVMCMTDGEKDVVFKRWDHLAKSFIVNTEETVSFPYEIVLSNKTEHDGRYAHSHLDPQDGMKTFYQHVKHIPSGIPENYSVEPNWFTRAILDDRFGGNMIAGIKAGHKVELPGGLDTDADAVTHSYGFAAAWVAEKSEDEDDDFSADFVIYSSGPAKDETSKKETIRGHSDGSASFGEGIRADYVSGWVEILSDPIQANGTDFVHNLNIPDPYILDVEVWFYPGTGTRVYSWSGSNSVSEAARYDGSVSVKDGNTITISVGNDGVFAVDNVDGSGTTNFASGHFLVVANKKPNLPQLP